jgi:tRNA G46 methylase TrmB
MSAGGNPIDPLTFPWYNSALPHIKQYARGNLLELGCGRGEFTVWLAGVLPQVNIVAVDFSCAAIGITRQYAAAKARNNATATRRRSRIEIA